jgi:putative inorganic carbon (HCO3(-)) transporter
MLRATFVSLLLAFGFAAAFTGPLQALLFYLWIAYFRPEQWVWTDFFRTLNLSYFAGLLLIGRTLFAGPAYRFDLRAALLAAMLAQSVVSSLLSPHFNYAEIYVRDFAKSAVITYLVAVLATDTRRLRLIFVVIALSLSFESAKQGWVQLLTNPGGLNANELPIFGDNNGVAVGMLMLVPILVALARSAASRPERLLFQFLTVGIVYRAISTYSRGGFIAAAALGLIFLARSPHKIRTTLAASLVAALVFSAMPTEYWTRMDTIVVSEGEERGASESSRLHFWEVAVEMARDNPFFGVGHNSFNLAYDQYDFSEGRYGAGRSVHSAWFGVLAELGIPGLALFTANLLVAWIACRRARRLAAQGRVSAELGHLATAVEAALVVASVGGAFVIFQYVEMLWHLVGASAAIHYITLRELAARTVPAPQPAAPPKLSPAQRWSPAVVRR